MSDLQCPATILLTRPGESAGADDSGAGLTARGHAAASALAERVRGRRLAHVCSSPAPAAVATARVVAQRCGTGLTVRADLGVGRDEAPGDDGCTARLGALLQELADTYRGETVLVVAPGPLVEDALPRLTVGAAPGHLDRCALVEVTADGDGWVRTAWDPAVAEDGTV